uniref:GG17040 n=2 Tax=Drosophila erecta TaxID=7220 RepID=B3P434_DROER
MPLHLPLPSLLPLAMILLLGTHLSGASAVDKDVAPVGDVKTDLLSLEQEIGGAALPGKSESDSQRSVLPVRRRRGIFFSGSIGGLPFLNWATGYSWAYPGYPYNYYGSPSPGYYGYGSGYYPGYLGYQKIIIG